jgi:hypothetical protein
MLRCPRHRVLCGNSAEPNGEQSRVLDYPVESSLSLARAQKAPGLARIPLGERHLRKAVKEYTEHHHSERNDQGLDNELIEKPTDGPNSDTAAECRERLAGILNNYHRRAV